MNTKKTYVVPTMEVVKVETASFLAASGLGLGATVNGREETGTSSPFWEPEDDTATP